MFSVEIVIGSVSRGHRSQTPITGDQHPHAVFEFLFIHLVLFHFQFRISGMSCP
jgi:hypothetical protein